jgi:hypothetical protein
VIQWLSEIGTNVNERNLADAIYSFAAETQSNATITITAILLIPQRAHLPKGSLESLENRRLKKHTVSVGIHHAPWVARVKIVVVAIRLTGVSGSGCAVQPWSSATVWVNTRGAISWTHEPCWVGRSGPARTEPAPTSNAVNLACYEPGGREFFSLQHSRNDGTMDPVLGACPIGLDQPLRPFRPVLSACSCYMRSSCHLKCFATSQTTLWQMRPAIADDSAYVTRQRQ